MMVNKRKVDSIASSDTAQHSTAREACPSGDQRQVNAPSFRTGSSGPARSQCRAAVDILLHDHCEWPLGQLADRLIEIVGESHGLRLRGTTRQSWIKLTRCSAVVTAVQLL